MSIFFLMTAGALCVTVEELLEHWKHWRQRHMRYYQVKPRKAS